MKLKKRARLWLQNLNLRWRWFQAKAVMRDLPEQGYFGLARCDIVYINLDQREDRRSKIESEFRRLGLENFVRFSAIWNENGALGCALSHHSILERWKPKPGQLLMVCEDDCAFLTDRSRLDALVEAFFRNNRLDVLCLAYNARNGCAVTQDFTITSDTQTMSCYIIREHMQSAFVEAAAESVRLLRKGLPKREAAIDVIWKKMQDTAFFAIPTQRVAFQTPSFSDIEKKDVDHRV